MSWGQIMDRYIPQISNLKYQSSYTHQNTHSCTKHTTVIILVSWATLYVDIKWIAHSKQSKENIGKVPSCLLLQHPFDTLLVKLVQGRPTAVAAVINSP